MNARLWLLLGLAVLAGCDSGRTPMGGRGAHLDAGAPEELWVHRQEPAASMDMGFEVLPAKRVFTVDESKQADAQQRLAAQAWALLSPEDARAYTGGAAIESGCVAVLLRGVEPILGRNDDGLSDTIRVKWKSGTVAVQHMALRNDFMPLRRRAIVALLPAEPHEVFVEALTAIY
jgi:hypothetical protein